MGSIGLNSASTWTPASLVSKVAKAHERLASDGDQLLELLIREGMKRMCWSGVELEASVRQGGVLRKFNLDVLPAPPDFEQQARE